MPGVKGYSPHGCDDHGLAAPKGPLAWGFLGSGFPWSHAGHKFWSSFFWTNFVLFGPFSIGELWWIHLFRCLKRFKRLELSSGLTHPSWGCSLQWGEWDACDVQGGSWHPQKFEALAEFLLHTWGCGSCGNWKEPYIFSSWYILIIFTTNIQSCLLWRRNIPFTHVWWSMMM